MTTFAMEILLSLMRIIGVRNFQTGDWMEFVGEEVLLVDDIARMPDFSSVKVKIESVQIVFCLEGRLDVTIDDKVHAVQKGEILFLSSNMVVSHYKQSEDIRAKVLIFSLKTIQEICNELDFAWVCSPSANSAARTWEWLPGSLETSIEVKAL